MARFIDNNDGTITDNHTGLMWELATKAKCNFEEANEYCRSSCLADHKDWRLPAIAELFTLVDHGRVLPCIDPIFSTTVASGYWSSTTYAPNPSVAWFVPFGNGYVLNDFKSFAKYVRAVRLNNTSCPGPATPY